jgi:Gas vesicle synthesis protein GvpO
VATEKSTTSRKTAASKGGSPTAKKQPGTGDGTARRASAPRTEPPKRTGAAVVAQRAARQLLELTGKEPEGVTGLERSDDGWTVFVDVAELHRVPNTTDVIATYEVEVDTDGNLTGYRRVRRFVRGTAGGE